MGHWPWRCRTRSVQACRFRLRQRLDARQIVGQRVVVEEEFLHLREGSLRPSQFVDDVSDAAHAIAMAAHGLRPEAEGAARFAAAA